MMYTTNKYVYQDKVCQFTAESTDRGLCHDWLLVGALLLLFGQIWNNSNNSRTWWDSNMLECMNLFEPKYKCDESKSLICFVLFQTLYSRSVFLTVLYSLLSASNFVMLLLTWVGHLKWQKMSFLCCSHVLMYCALLPNLQLAIQCYCCMKIAQGLMQNLWGWGFGRHGLYIIAHCKGISY
jgi:hypothetical protein